MGIRSLQRLLMIMDDNGDKRLSKDELKYGLRDYGIVLSPAEMDQVFMYFDRDGNGFVDITEFLVGIRGEINERRKKIIKLAFDILDLDKSGFITVDEMSSVYDVSQDPQVVQGIKTEKEALAQFLSQWDRGDKDGIVTYDEFEDYYKEISASIDGDDYFELMMRNAWRIAGGKGAAANTANLRVLVTDANGRQKVATVEQELGLKQGDREEIRRRLAKQGVEGDISLTYGTEAKNDKHKGKAAPGRASVGKTMPPPPPERRVASGSGSRPTPMNRAAPPQASAVATVKDDFDPLYVLHTALYDPPCNFEDLGKKLAVSVVTFVPRVARGAFLTQIQKLSPLCDRSQCLLIWKTIDPNDVGSIELQQLHDFLSSRFGKDKSAGKGLGVIEGVKARILQRCGEKAGIKGLQRTLSIMDDNGDKRLSKDELKYGLRDYGIDLNLRELDEIFLAFDRDRNGFIDVTEFLVGVRGELNDRRKEMIGLAFNILDTDRSGFITVEEIKDKYDVSQDPKVISGEKTEEEVLHTFLDQWDRGDKDGIVTYDEFEDYYKEISASIDGDDYFELMMRNAWRIAGGKGAAANTANLRVLVTDANGRQKVATVEQELGLKQGDREEIRRRLAKQGVEGDISLTYGTEAKNDKHKGKAAPVRAAPSNANFNIKQQESKAGVNVGPPHRSQFDRNVAAMKLAAAFRGRVGRKKALQEKRKVEAKERAKAEAEAEANRPRAKRLIRPIPKARPVRS